MRLTGFFFLVLSVFLVNACESVAGENLNLSEDGKALMQIVVASDVIPAEKTAALELQKYLNQITGGKFEIVDKASTDSGAIYVGRSDYVDRVCKGVNWKKLGAEGIVIQTKGDNLILAGGRPRGTIYAVYTFLQDTLGCRWYADDAEEVIPQNKTLKVGPRKTVVKPAFEYRQIYSEPVKKPLFAAKLRQNGRQFSAVIPETHGGSITMGGAHTLLPKLVDPKKQFKKHPEWFAYREDQKKRVSTQLCLTNKELHQEVARKVLADLDKRYSTWQDKPKIVSVSCADNNKPCQCPMCLASVKRNGSESGPLMEIVNYVAEEVGKKYPDVLISTLAYWHTEKPPKQIRPRKNVLVQVGVLDRNHKNGIGDVPRFNRYIKKWRKMTPHVYMWDYYAHFANFIQPHPNHFAIGKSLRFYCSNGVSGVFIQGQWGSAGEFMRMRAWVTSQLLWNPNQNDRKLMKEFVNGYYGEAGPYLMQYIELINKTINRQKNSWLGCYGKNSTKGWLGIKEMNAATKLFNAALEAVENDKTLTYRVRRTKLSLDIIWIQRYHELKREAAKTNQPFMGPSDPYAELERIEKNEFSISSYREWASFAEYLGILRKNFPKKPKKKDETAPPVECKKLSSGQWEDIQQDRLIALLKEDVKIIDDPKASDGRAMLLSGDAHKLQASFDLPKYLQGRWRIYVVARAEPIGENPGSIVMGIYARNSFGGNANEICRLVADCPRNLQETYRTFDLGEYRLEGGATIWVQPNGVGDYGDAKKTYIDRIFLVYKGQ